MGRRGGGGGARETHALSRVGGEKLPPSCARSCPSPAAAVAGGGGGSGVRPGVAARARGREPNSARRSPARAALGLRRSPPCAAWARPDSETFTRESERALSGEDAGSTRPALGDALPRSPAPPSPGAGSPPPARVGGALSRPGPGRRPPSLPRPDPKGLQTINKVRV